jgi:hypothetical protein
MLRAATATGSAATGNEPVDLELKLQLVSDRA